MAHHWTNRDDLWTDKEDAILMQIYPSEMTIPEMRKFLPGRSEFGIQRRANKLGLRRPTPTSPKWTAAEDQIIIKNHSQMTYKQMESILPGRTEGAIYCRAFILGLRKKKPVRRKVSPVARRSMRELREMFFEEEISRDQSIYYR